MLDKKNDVKYWPWGRNKVGRAMHPDNRILLRRIARKSDTALDSEKKGHSDHERLKMATY